MWRGAGLLLGLRAFDLGEEALDGVSTETVRDFEEEFERELTVAAACGRLCVVNGIVTDSIWEE